MATTLSSIEEPKHDNKPFIAIGSFFIFTTPTNSSKKFVGRIVKASESAEGGAEENHPVTVNVFDSFDDWSGITTICPVQRRLGENPREVVLTSKLADFHFDRDTCDAAFMFATSELSQRGAVLRGINNAAARMEMRSKMDNLCLSLL
jgi:hypothetical protein